RCRSRSSSRAGPRERAHRDRASAPRTRSRCRSSPAPGFARRRVGTRARPRRPWGLALGSWARTSGQTLALAARPTSPQPAHGLARTSEVKGGRVELDFPTWTGVVTLEAHASRHWQLGPLRVWAERRRGGIKLAAARGPDPF